jgi:hypothetical protein
MNFRIGWDSRADNPKLPALQIYPQRLSQRLQPFQIFGYRAFQGHDRIEPQPAYQWMADNFGQERGIGWGGDDSLDRHSGYQTFNVVAQ